MVAAINMEWRVETGLKTNVCRMRAFALFALLACLFVQRVVSPDTLPPLSELDPFPAADSLLADPLGEAEPDHLRLQPVRQAVATRADIWGPDALFAALDPVAADLERAGSTQARLSYAPCAAADRSNPLAACKSPRAPPLV
ncbi:hypothetical protein [Pelagibacterium lacus]|uniref:Uncharacterized protein n=1 Tax=Pelagibacterium lacus TaxID=2282655 RepID=A0A369W399_9HYPH|nr:hypothetical protein [Pelagibacterium lacus]RDE09154.1 hypothetical protein DVH29_08160 [Pelagibacterium lacus]